MNTRTSSLWPYGIIATFGLFAIMILYFVFVAMRSEVNLVSPDYYAYDKKFNEHQAAAQNADQLGSALILENDAARQVFTIGFPQTGAVSSAKLLFFRPSDYRMDFQIELAPNADNRQQISTAKLAKGHWQAKLQFAQNGKTYFKETYLQIN